MRSGLSWWTRIAAPTTSTMASMAPTSWKCTSSTVVPCILASASASVRKMRRAVSLTSSSRGAAVDHRQHVVQAAVHVLVAVAVLVVMVMTVSWLCSWSWSWLCS